jgi:hypothetical protein
MNINEFKAEAERLARLNSIFRTDGTGTPSACWYGVDPGLSLSLLHNGEWLNIYLHDDCDGGHVDKGSEPDRSGVPLFPEPCISLPPVDAIFLLGGEAVGEFLQ